MAPELSNLAIATAFDELADLYELDGAVVHRVLAYRTAAKTVRGATVSIAALTREGRVTSLPGIGKTLEEKIGALLDTGTIPSAEKLRAKYPSGLLDLTRLPGLGPKRARRLFDELGVDSLQALKEAAEGRRLRDVRGFGARFEESVLAALEAGVGGRPAPRMLLPRALGEGEQIVAGLLEHPSARRVELAGSARRQADSVKDLDIIATADDPGALVRALGELPVMAESSAPERQRGARAGRTPGLRSTCASSPRTASATCCSTSPARRRTTSRCGRRRCDAACTSPSTAYSDDATGDDAALRDRGGGLRPTRPSLSRARAA